MNTSTAGESVQAVNVTVSNGIRFIPYQPLDLDSLDQPEFDLNGWTVADFDNPEIYKAVYVFGSSW